VLGRKELQKSAFKSANHSSKPPINELLDQLRDAVRIKQCSYSTMIYTHMLSQSPKALCNPLNA
jgi:hypothetical protein